MLMARHSRYLQVGVAVLVLISPAAMASGFRIPEASVYGMSSANAVVADTDSPGALAYNPAAMGFHSGTSFVAGITTVDPDITVTTASGQFSSDVDAPFYIPNLVFAGQLGSGISAGIIINSPFGLETNWPDETFPAFAGPFDALEPSRSKLEMANFNPNIAILLAPDTSLAIGFDYYWVKSVRLDTAGVKISGNGDGVGLNVAFLHRMASDWSVGLSWRSRVTTEIDGTVSAGGISAPATTEISFPAMLQAGVRSQVTPTLEIEFDVEHTDWSSFNVLSVSHTHPGLPTPITSTNVWKDSLAFRIGGSLDLGPSTELRFGYTTDKAPNLDTHFSARVPDSDRQLFSVGVGQEIGGNWTVEAGYTYVLWEDRNFGTGVPFGAFGTDPSGTNAVNGNYEADAHLFGLGVNGNF